MLLQNADAAAGGRVGTSILGAASPSGAAVGELKSSTAGNALSDFDGDGVVDSADNCPTVHANGGPNGCPVRPTVRLDRANEATAPTRTATAPPNRSRR